MRSVLSVVAAVVLVGCHGRYVHAVRTPPDVSQQCVSECKSVQAIKEDAEDYLVCLHRCGAVVSKRGEDCSEQPRGRPGVCVDEEVPYVSAVRTILLIGGIVFGAGAVVSLNASYAARPRP